MKHLLSLLVLLLTSCISQPTTDNQKESSEQILRRMKRPVEDISMIITPEQYNDYINHYWDDFDFEIGENVDLYDHDDLYSAFANYVRIIPPKKADSLLRRLIQRADKSREVLDLFSTMAHDILYDPNSPARNDEYYIPILETLCESKLLDEYDRIIPQHTLQIVKQNRVGHVANDFSYTLINGQSFRLHSIDADYTILLFNNPGCEMCKSIIEQINNSERLKELSKRYRITTLAIYPDEDLEAWRNYLKTKSLG